MSTLLSDLYNCLNNVRLVRNALIHGILDIIEVKQVGDNALLQRFPYAESSDSRNTNCPEFPGYTTPIFWAK